MASEGESFATVPDVEGLLQRGAFTGQTRPTADDVLGFLLRRSARVEATLFAGGQPYTVPDGSNPFPETPTTDIERQLKALANAAAAAGAAADAAMAHEGSASSDVPVAAVFHERQFEQAMSSIEALCSAKDTASASISRPTFDTSSLPWSTRTQW